MTVIKVASAGSTAGAVVRRQRRGGGDRGPGARRHRHRSRPPGSPIDDDSVSLVAASVPDALAVVVAPPLPAGRGDDRARETLREVNALPVLLLARRMQDDVLLQELQPATGGLTSQLVPLEPASRSAPSEAGSDACLRFGLLEIDTGSREVRVDDQVVELSRRSSTSSRSRVVARSSLPRLELLEGVWHSSGEWQAASTVTEHVRRIRIKLHSRPDLPIGSSPCAARATASSHRNSSPFFSNLLANVIR